MEYKTYQGRVEFKADEAAEPTGEFSVVFATLNVIDHDGDVTLPGAFKENQDVIVEVWNHNYSQLPVGRGAIREEGDKAVFEGVFFLDTQNGMEHYKTIKALGDLARYSYTFEIEESEPGEFEGQRVRFLKALDVWGIAPVERGAGIGSGTLSIKQRGAKGAIGSHSTPTTDAAWDGPANEARVRSGEDAAYYRRIYAWQDADGDPAVKATYKFIHHMVAGDGTPGAANIRACTTGIGVLNGARGGTTIPDADRRGVWNHLARHLRDADIEPPELKAAKVGARHTRKEYEDIQQIHDLAVELGAKCAEGDSTTQAEGEGGDQDETQTGKSRNPLSSTLAARVALELMAIGVEASASSAEPQKH